MTYKKLWGRPVAEKIKGEIERDITLLREKNIQPTLATIRVGEDAGSVAYERSATKQLSQLGMSVKNYVFNETIAEDALLDELSELATLENIHGLLIMQPLPAQIHLDKLVAVIPAEKDVDGLHPMNLGYLMQGREDLLMPSTVRAVLHLLDFYEIPVKGQNICVIGKSNTVGKPLSVALLNRRATVTNVHTQTRDIKAFTKQADVIIAAAGAKHLVDHEMILDGATLIDIGYNVIDGKVYGDINEKEIGGRAKAITPVPGGVGAVTTAALAEQLVRAALIQTK